MRDTQIERLVFRSVSRPCSAMIALAIIRVILVADQLHGVHERRAVIVSTNNVVLAVSRAQDVVHVDADTVEALSESEHALIVVLVSVDQVEYTDTISSLLSLGRITNVEFDVDRPGIFLIRQQ